MTSPGSLKDMYLRDLDTARGGLEKLHNEMYGCVNGARRHGASWAEIAKVLGCSKQAAQQRYGKLVAAPLASTDLVFSEEEK